MVTLQGIKKLTKYYHELVFMKVVEKILSN